MDTSERMLTRRQFADGESISLCTVDRLISQGAISAFKYGRLTRIPESERDRFRSGLKPKRQTVA
jgi:excisionase family DNA binding protein